jgi:hypothetical protein
MKWCLNYTWPDVFVGAILIFTMHLWAPWCGWVWYSISLCCSSLSPQLAAAYSRMWRWWSALLCWANERNRTPQIWPLSCFSLLCFMTSHEHTAAVKSMQLLKLWASDAMVASAATAIRLLLALIVPVGPPAFDRLHPVTVDWNAFSSRQACSRSNYCNWLVVTDAQLISRC